MKSLLITLVACLFVVGAFSAEPVAPGMATKVILGRWDGAGKSYVFHADGCWDVILEGVGSTEDSEGRHWHLKGSYLILTHPLPKGHDVYSIVSFTPEKLVIERDGRQEEYRHSP